MDFGINGRVALVTAASKGLGRAIALELAREGCSVAICSRTKPDIEAAAHEIQSETGAAVLPLVADIGLEQECERVVNQAATHFSRLDILITNTGGPTPGTFATIAENDWYRGIELTLMNVVRLIRHARPHMAQRKWGRIVNVTSLSARQPIEGLLLSNALRPAVHGMAKTLSRELAPNGILVNNVCPGMHHTSRLEELAQVRSRTSGRTVHDELETMASAIPLNRLGDPAELAAVAAFLCSQRASFITGQSIIVDGGASLALS
ncbi:MAG: SDR family oxidoreductase [Phycisphaeraceae bacterium]|nr:SDR family oxidoreductase [Phycisphaeraceae bacterium]MCW5761823.1 SDR family oxidoreductase [Phycisphaeraceae bacterium]